MPFGFAVVKGEEGLLGSVGLVEDSAEIGGGENAMVSQFSW